MIRGVVLLIALGLSGCGGSSNPAAGSIPACVTPLPAPSIPPADRGQLAVVRTGYEAAMAQNDPHREAINRRLADADRRGDTKGVQAAIAESLGGPHPIYELLKAATVPTTFTSDMKAYIQADDDVKAADEAYVRAATDTAVRDAANRRNVALRDNENTANQFRVDLGMPPTPCPYTGP